MIKRQRKKAVVGIFLVLALTFVLLLGSGTVLAGQGRGGNVIQGPGPHFINDPGNYNVKGLVGRIVVFASNVHINLSEGIVDCGGAEPGLVGINIFDTDNVRINGSLTGTVRNCGVGVFLLGGGNHHINGVVATLNDAGIVLSGPNQRFPQTPTSNNNHINGNDTSLNNGVGIAVGGGNNRINGNIALGNGGLFDLFDFNLDCDANKWNSNVFGTANQACIN